MLCAQTLHAVRTEIIQALNPDALTRGQLDFDASMITKPHKRKVRRDPKTNEIIHSEPVKGTESRGFKRASCPLPPNAFDLSKISKEILVLSPERRALAYFTYQLDAQWCYTETSAQWLWRTFLAHQTKKLRAKKEKQLKGMVFLAMQNWRCQLIHGEDLHKPKRVRECLQINEHHWVRDWLPHWNKMHTLLDGFENQILRDVHHATYKKRNNSTVRKTNTSACLLKLSNSAIA